MSKAIDLTDLGQHGHDKGTRVYSAIDGAELNAAHAHASKQSQVYEYDAQDQKDATGDLGKRTSRSEDLRHEIDRPDNGPTYVTAQENENVRDTKSGTPKNGGR